MQTVSAAHFWRLGEQVSSFKVPTGHSAALDAELFAIRLDVVKATSFDIKCIILITDNYPSYQGRHFLSLKGGNCKPLQPSNTKGSSWLLFIGKLVSHIVYQSDLSHSQLCFHWGV